MQWRVVFFLTDSHTSTAYKEATGRQVFVLKMHRVKCNVKSLW
jgi:hypothetical protein